MCGTEKKAVICHLLQTSQSLDFILQLCLKFSGSFIWNGFCLPKTDWKDLPMGWFKFLVWFLSVTRFPKYITQNLFVPRGLGGALHLVVAVQLYDMLLGDLEGSKCTLGKDWFKILCWLEVVFPSSVKESQVLCLTQAPLRDVFVWEQNYWWLLKSVFPGKETSADKCCYCTIIYTLQTTHQENHKIQNFLCTYFAWGLKYWLFEKTELLLNKCLWLSLLCPCLNW